MKKLLALLLPGLFIFSSCSFGDLLVDEVTVHNTLVQKMDRVLMSEEDFFNEYMIIVDDEDTTPIEESYAEFKTAAEDLDEFFEDTTFASGQAVFKEEYDDYFKDFLMDYLEAAGDFVDDVAKNGYTYDSMFDHFEKVDEYAEEYVEIHNRLIDTINVQSDYLGTASGYE